MERSSGDSVIADVKHRVEGVLVDLLAADSVRPDIQIVAARMGTSVRTLQRRLLAAGLTYSHVLQQTRCAAAREMLKDRQQRISEVARRLGYSDPAHFTRAFRRWMGFAPRDLRRRC
jgi:AraC-like DNA-binding protein